MSERFVISAGGTGGHVFPALALAKALRAKGQEPVIITDRRGARFIDSGQSSHIIAAASPSGGLSARLKAILRLLLGTLQSWRIASQLQPSAVASFGGYASFPAALAARLRKIPVLLHEQNAIFGRANLALARFANAVALSYPETENLPVGSFAKIVTGNPVRPGFGEFATERSTNDSILVTILGGSQGARVLSDALPGALIALPCELRQRLKIVQQCRPEDIGRVRELYGEAGMDVELATFFDNVAQLMSRSDLVVTRSGASTVAELTACGCPAILIPYLHAADGHQEANAKQLAKAGAAVMIRQPDVSVEHMSETIRSLLEDNSKLASMRKAMEGLARPNAAEELAEAMLLLASRRKNR